MKLTREEMETHIYFNQEKDCIATIATFQTKLRKKLEKYSKECEAIKILYDKDGEMIAELPKSLLSVNIKDPSKKRIITQEHKEKLLKAIEKARKKKKVE